MLKLFCPLPLQGSFPSFLLLVVPSVTFLGENCAYPWVKWVFQVMAKAPIKFQV